MRRIMQPAPLLAAAALLAMAIGAYFLLRRDEDPAAHPEAVAGNEQEIAWLSYGNNGTSWERFVAGIATAKKRLEERSPGLELVVDQSKAFPAESTAVPEVVLSLAGASDRTRIRWYKLTSRLSAQLWVQALLKRDPPPLAIIGGPFSNTAIRVAEAMENPGKSIPAESTPLFLITAATKSRLIDDTAETLTDSIVAPYQDHTFRFCFANTRVTESVCDFIWGQPDLRPTCPNYYVAYWEDDRYSEDLRWRFRDTLASTARMPPVSPFGAVEPLVTSVGMFDRPNEEETKVARQILDDLETQDRNSRPLLVLSGQFPPCRRMLRAIDRLAPGAIGRFVVTAGDAISFSRIFRDRDVDWPIQDYPCDLVLFAHRNPVDAVAGFRRGDDSEAQKKEEPEQPSKGAAGSSGADDVLVNSEIIETLVLAAHERGEPLKRTAHSFDQVLREVRWDRAQERICFDEDKPRLFDRRGDRANGTGEHIIWLHPRLDADRGLVLPRASLRIYVRPAPDAPWRMRCDPLELRYDIPVN